MKHIVPPQVLSSITLFLFVASGMLSAQQNQTYSQARLDHPDWVQVPGELIRPDCVHEIPSGATVEVGNDGQISVERDIARDLAVVSNLDRRATGDFVHAIGTDQLAWNLYPIRMIEPRLTIRLVLLRAQHPARDKQEQGDAAQDLRWNDVFHNSS